MPGTCAQERAPVPVLTEGHVEPSQSIHNSLAWADQQGVADDTDRWKGNAYKGGHTWL